MSGCNINRFTREDVVPAPAVRSSWSMARGTCDVADLSRPYAIATSLPSSVERDLDDPFGWIVAGRIQ